MRRLTASLATKLMLCLVGSMALVFGLLGYLSLRLQRQHLEDVVFENAGGISDLIRRNIRHSTDTEEVSHLLDTEGEAWYQCHAQAQPLSRLERPDRMGIYRTCDRMHVLGLITPIENEPDCSNPAYHAHAADSRILGVLGTNLSLARVDQNLRERERALVLFTAISILIVCMVSVELAWAMVRKPVRALVEGTRHVAEGAAFPRSFCPTSSSLSSRPRRGAKG